MRRQRGRGHHAARRASGTAARIAFAAGQFVAAAEAQPLYLRNKIAYTSAERLDMQAAKAAAESAQ